MEPRRIREEEVIVLDYLPNGYPSDSRPIHLKQPIVQVIGTQHFALLELVTRKGAQLQPHDRISLGDGQKAQPHYISGRLSPSRLTSTARAELEYAIATIVKKDEQRFIDFFNTARPLSTRMHSLELIPGMGKKRMWEILDARDEQPFINFADMRKRCKLIPDPEKAIIRRIFNEIDGVEKHLLFVDR